MINFRFHLISIVAIFLALAMGVSLGSGFFGAPIVEDLRTRTESVRQRNIELRNKVDELDRRVDEDEEFATAIKAWVTDGTLRNRKVLIVSFGDAQDELSESAIAAVEQAGGEVTARISLLDKLALQTAPEREELALILASTSVRAADLQLRMASLLSRRLAASSERASDPNAATRRLRALLEPLQRAGYLAVEQHGDAIAPPQVAYLVLGGGRRRAPFDAARFAAALVTPVTELGNAAVVAESSASSWGLVRTLREDEKTSSEASTVDQAETAQGQIALVLSLAQALDGAVGHYGYDDGAAAPIPQPTPALRPPP